jgi:hypothetical protein
LPGRRPSGDRRGKNRRDKDKAPATAQSPKITSQPNWISDEHRPMLSHIAKLMECSLNWRILSRNHTNYGFPTRANPRLSKYIGKKFSMEFQPIWRSGCTYKR